MEGTESSAKKTTANNNNNNKRREKISEFPGNHLVPASPVNPHDLDTSPPVASTADGDPSSPHHGKCKSKNKSPRRSKSSAGSLADEDIIDGFAFLSFKSIQDLDTHVQSTIHRKSPLTCSSVLSKTSSLGSPLGSGPGGGRCCSPTSAGGAPHEGLSLKAETATTCTPSAACMLKARTTPTIAETVSRPLESPPPPPHVHATHAPNAPSYKKAKKEATSSPCAKRKKANSTAEPLQCSHNSKIINHKMQPEEAPAAAAILPTPPPSKSGSSTCSSDCGSSLSKDDLDLCIPVIATPDPTPPASSSSPSLPPPPPHAESLPSLPPVVQRPPPPPPPAPSSSSASSTKLTDLSSKSTALDRHHNVDNPLQPCPLRPSRPAYLRDSENRIDSNKDYRTSDSADSLFANKTKNHVPSSAPGHVSALTPLQQLAARPPGHLFHPHHHLAAQQQQQQQQAPPPPPRRPSSSSSTGALHPNSSSTNTTCVLSTTATTLSSTSTTCATAIKPSPRSSLSRGNHSPATSGHRSSSASSPSGGPRPSSAFPGGLVREPSRPIPGLSGLRDEPSRTPLLPHPWTNSSSISGAPPHAGQQHHLSQQQQQQQHQPSAALHPLSGLHHQASFGALSLQHPLLQQHHPSQQNMFAPQLAPPHSHSALPSTPLHGGPATTPYAAAHAPEAGGGGGGGGFGANPDILNRAHLELNARFLQDRGMAPGVSPPSAAAAAAAFSLRAEMHQHNHLHNHQHMHQHYGPLPPPNGPPAPPPPPPHLKPPPSLPPHPSPAGPNLLGGAHSLAELERERAKMQGLTAGYPGLGPLMHPGGLPPTPLGSGLQGAFQPKATVPTSMHHTQLLMSLDRQKTAAAAAAAAAASGVPPPPPSVSAGLKKPGKWCAAHVRIAWEIHLHQQKQQAESRSSSNSSSNDGPKSSADPLRPPSHLFPPSSNPLHRPGASSAASTADLISSSALLGVHGRNPYDAAGHYPFLTPGALGIPPFPRPAPYGNLTGLGSNAFGGLASVGNGPFGRPSELSAIPGLTPPQEWNRLRRTPPSFPTPPAWPKSEAERERDKERERSGSARPNSCNSGPLSRDKREGSRDRDVKDFARDREMKERQHRERIPSRGSPAAECRSLSIDQRSRDTKDMRHASRSRSRSPIVRNGPASSSGPTEHKAPSAPSAESMLFPVSSKHPSLPPPHEVRVKEERKDDVMVIEPKERPRPPDFGPAKVNADLMMANSKAGGMLHPGFAGLFSNPMLHEQQQRLLSSLYPHPATSTAAALAAAGLHHSQHAAPPPPPPPMWQHLELSQHRMELQREMEREKEHLLRRFGVSAEHERLREQQEMLLRQQQHNRLLAAEHHERATAAAAAAVEKDSEGSKLLPPPLRPADLYAATRGPPATHSPLHMHNSKSNSPACTVGAPPPLISSSLGGGGGGCGSAGSSHCNSPVIKTAAAKTSPLHSNSQQQSEKDSSSSQQLSSANGHDAEQLQSR